MKSSQRTGVIKADELYSKQELFNRMGISQKTWDKLLSEGLPYAELGNSRWVSGQALLDYFERVSKRKNKDSPNQS
jgi:hypothetical protein